MIILAIAAGIAAASPGAANAEAGQSVEVRYADLDLSTAAGERRLRSRIAYAANTVCPIADGRDLIAMDAWRACQADALRSAKGQVEAALSNARTRMASASSPAVVGLTKADR